MLNQGLRTKAIGKALGIKEKVAGVLIKRLGYRFVKDKRKQVAYVQKYREKLKREGRITPCLVPDYVNAQRRKWKKLNAEKVKEQSSRYYNKHKNGIAERLRRKRRNDLYFRIKSNLRTRVYELTYRVAIRNS
jgi:hypothetical protein